MAKRFIVSFPDLMSEWDYSKNTHLDPTTLSFGCTQVVKWRCHLGHEWSAKINARTTGQNCPYCSRRRISDLNRLSVNYPEVAKEWDLSKNKDLKPSEVTYGSHKKVWWRCAENHSWQSEVKSRTSGSGCPHCPKTRLAKVESGNSLSDKFPTIAKEWHGEKNHPLDASDVNHSSNKKYWWECSRGHVWEATANNRTRHMSGCPNCSGGTSQQEMRIFAELESIFDAKNRWKLNHVELDIYLPALKLGVEFDGWYWHKGKVDKDSRKNSMFKDNGIKVVRVREKPLAKLSDDDLIVEQNTITKKTVDDLLIGLSKYADEITRIKIQDYTKKKNFVNDDRFKELLSFYPAPHEERSLAFVHPDLAKEWHPTKNFPLEVNMISYGSEIKVWWQCEHGHEFESTPHTRHVSAVCPTCLGIENRLDLKFPELALRWHPTKNGDLLPSDVTCGSSQKVWWKCSDTHECEGAINSRSIGHNCVICPLTDRKGRLEKWQVSSDQNLMKFWHYDKNLSFNPDHLTYGSNQIVWWRCQNGHEWEEPVKSLRARPICPNCSNKRGSQVRLLANTHPELAKELHPTKNDLDTIHNLTYGSKRKVWWQCAVGHEWMAKPNGRTNSQGCPYCSGRRLSDKNRLTVCRPDISSLWHPSKNSGSRPSEVSFSSNAKFWWRCIKGHEWITSVNEMDGRKTLCTKCRKNERLLSVSFPNIALDWDYTRNGILKPTEIMYGSGKKVWWICSKNHSWEATIGNRTIRGSGCPTCAKSKY